MKKKLVFIAALVIIVTGTITGASMAAYHAVVHTDKTIKTSSLDIRLNIDGGVSDGDGNIIFSSKDIKNNRIDEKVSALNCGKKAQYVRVKIDKSWINNNLKDDKACRAGLIESKYIGINLINQDDWIVPQDSLNEGEYIYYKRILNPGEKTSAFMDSFTLFDNIMENTNKYSGLSVKINFDAQAVQTTSAKAAMLNEWGVIAEFDNEGNIISITQGSTDNKTVNWSDK